MKEIEVFFDGDCPLCSREINLLKKLDKNNNIVFTDIANENFEASNYGLTFNDFMAEIRGKLPDGTMISGVEVIRCLYEAVGLKWTVAITRLPIISTVLDLGYKLFAKNRLRFTGRCNSEKGCKL
jgi:predicted DCC family thiol-disulfide oxidoreductase YuxK